MAHCPGLSLFPPRFKAVDVVAESKLAEDSEVYRGLVTPLKWALCGIASLARVQLATRVVGAGE